MTSLLGGENTKRRVRKTIPLDVPPDLYHDFRQLLREQLTADSCTYTGASAFKADYLLREFESKLLDTSISGVTDQQRHGAAIEKWLRREGTNRLINQRIQHCDDTDFLFLDGNGFPVFAAEFVAWCNTAISKLLGEEIPWDKLKGSFSGGASTSVKRGVGNIPTKYQEGSNITEAAVWHYLRLTRDAQSLPRDLELVRGNGMFTVPKTSNIDRVACKEPELNMYCQKAVGDYIRRKLKANGVDLNDQRVNQGLSRLGSIDGTLATIDLSSASDSVTISLVQKFLPFEWSMLLMELRSPETWVPAYVDTSGSLVEAHWHINEMISSMGNAFTFELESLLFWTLARGCAYFTRTQGRISVYGDDIICPSGLRESMESVLDFFGFSLNPKKTFWDGDFRESCGKHWYSGVEVTPFYVKKLPSKLSDWCLLLNHLRSWASSVNGICDPSYWPLWSLFAEKIPRPLWGARDLARRDALVAPNIRNTARILLKQEGAPGVESRLQTGAYTQWLDTTESRVLDLNVINPAANLKKVHLLVDRRCSAVETNVFVDPAKSHEMLSRQPWPDWSLGMPEFPQEILA